MDSNSGTTTKLQRLAPVRIFEQAVEQIRNLISSGDLEVGQKLPTEQELSRQLGVSRSSVREALRVLEAEGSVEIRHGSGTYISSRRVQSDQQGELLSWLSQREETLEQVMEVRESIEPLAASLAAVRASQESLNEIRAIVAEQVRLSRQSGESDLDDLAHLDEMFHLAVSAASGNDIAHEIISHLIPAFNASNRAVMNLSHRAQKMESEHLKILSALDVRDAVAAGEAMQIHLQQVKQQIIDFRSDRSGSLPVSASR